MTTAASEYGLLSDYGIPDNFIKELGSTITPGSSAIFLLIRSFEEDKLLAESQNTKERFSRRHSARSMKRSCGPPLHINVTKRPVQGSRGLGERAEVVFINS